MAGMGPILALTVQAQQATCDASTTIVSSSSSVASICQLNSTVGLVSQSHQAVEARGTLVVKRIPYRMLRNLLFSPSFLFVLIRCPSEGVLHVLTAIPSASADMILALVQRRSARTQQALASITLAAWDVVLASGK